MSYDLTVWHQPSQITNEEASQIYKDLCKGDLSGVIPYAGIDAFYDELTSKYPEIDDIPEADIDNLDLCPWSVAFDRSPGHLIICSAQSKAEHVHEIICELAEEHNLAVYDPQSEMLINPKAKRAEESTDKKASDQVINQTLPKPTYKKWIKIGAIMAIIPIAILIYIFNASKGGKMPEIYNYVPVWSGVFVLPTYILGMILLTVGLVKRKSYRVANGLPLLRPAVIYLLLTLFLLLIFAAFFYWAYTKAPDLAGPSVDIAELKHRIAEVGGAIVGGLGFISVVFFLILAFSGFRLHRIEKS